MEPSDKAGPRKRQVEGWRQVARRTDLTCARQPLRGDLFAEAGI